MTQTHRNPWRPTTAPALIAALVFLSTGCRGNLGSAVAVATGRADIQSLQTTTAQRTALTNPAATGMTSGGAYPSINQASFSPDGGRKGPATAGAFPAVDPATGNPAVPPSRDEAFTTILPELQRLGEVNPAAQQRLLAEMKTADPAHWPLLVRRIQADLGVHQQLNQSEASAGSVEEASHSNGSHDHQHTTPSRSGTRPAAGSDSRPAVFDQQTAAPKQDQRFPVTQVAYNEPAPNAEQGSSLSTAFSPPPIHADSQGIGMKNPFVQSSPADGSLAGSASRGSAGRGAWGNEPTGRKPMAKLLGSPSSPPDRQGLGPKVVDNPMASPSTDRVDWRDALRQAIADLDQTAPNPPQSAGESYQHARLRLLQLAAGDLDGASTAIPGLSSTEQSYWSHQLFAISKLMDEQTHPETKRRAAAANLHLAKAAAELDELSSLTVRSLTFCDKVYGFGAYDPIDDPTFRPGAQLTLYAEVRHYKSMRVGSGLHAATLATSYRLLNSRGDVIESDDFPLIEDECYSKRRDFHIQFTYPLPEDLRAGEYRLELTLEDRLGHKRGTSSIDLWVE